MNTCIKCHVLPNRLGLNGCSFRGGNAIKLLSFFLPSEKWKGVFSKRKEFSSKGLINFIDLDRMFMVIIVSEFCGRSHFFYYLKIVHNYKYSILQIRISSHKNEQPPPPPRTPAPPPPPKKKNKKKKHKKR